MSTQTITRDQSRVQPSLMTDQKQGQQSLVKAGSVALTPTIEPISDPGVFLSKVEQLRHDYNIIAPPVQVMGGFTPGYAIAASLVSVNTSVNADGQGAETYRDKGFMKEDQRALNRVGLAKVASAAGVKWTPNTGRRDDGTIPYLWRYLAEGLVDTADGGYQIVSGEVEIDFRDGSPQIGGWTPEGQAELERTNKGKPQGDQKWSIGGWSQKRVMQARTMGARYAETKAKNRAIRSMGLQQVYTLAELMKPFLVFKAVYVPDMSDPVVRQMVAQRALHGRQMLYPSMAAVSATPMLAAPVPPAGTIDASAVTAGAGAADDGPAGCHVTEIAEVGRANGETVYEVRFSDKRVGRTADGVLVEDAFEAKRERTLVDPELVASERVQGVFVLLKLRAVKTAQADLY